MFEQSAGTPATSGRGQRALWILLGVAAALVLSCDQHQKPAEDEYVAWLRDRSMLAQATAIAREVSATGQLWQRPYALPRPRAAAARASAWFTAYPASTLTRPGMSALGELGDPALWRAFREIGIKGMHTGPLKRSGGLRGRDQTPTVDGYFDRITMEIDPSFGTEEQYRKLTRNAHQSGAMVIGDLIPGHTGKGPDFSLAERAYQDYPGIFHMVAVRPEDWALLPSVPEGRDSVNLPIKAVEALRAKGYIVGELPRVIFASPGVKDTNWSATAKVKGVDGKERRWVYLHRFKEGQPSLNWLDPSFAAQRLVLGDAMHSLIKLGEDGLRLDANGLLGLEPDGKGRVWSDGHPLSVTSNQLIGSLVRMLGGFTFQELNLTLEDLERMSQGGADLSYDFVTRPAYHHALVTGDTSLLRLMYTLMRRHHIDPGSLIHALQNHDELNMDLAHFSLGHMQDRFPFRGREATGAEIRQTVLSEMMSKLVGPRAPQNLQAGDGVSCTTASFIAAALGVTDPAHASAADRARIQKVHLLLAAFNALQPGIFALSGWDLTGSLTVPAQEVKQLMADGDTRWVERGSYDLLGTSAGARRSPAGLPRAEALYGPLPEQLRHPGSFASQLGRLLRAREQVRLYAATLLEVPDAQSKSLLVLVNELPDQQGLEVSAINFGSRPIEEQVVIRGAAGKTATDLLQGGSAAGTAAQDGSLRLTLGPYEARALLLK